MSDWNEERQARFKRTSVDRMNKVFHRLELLRRCASKNSSDYSQTDVDFMFQRLRQEVDRVEKAFRPQAGSGETPTFNWPAQGPSGGVELPPNPPFDAGPELGEAAPPPPPAP